MEEQEQSRQSGAPAIQVICVASIELSNKTSVCVDTWSVISRPQAAVCELLQQPLTVVKCHGAAHVAVVGSSVCSASNRHWTDTGLPVQFQIHSTQTYDGQHDSDAHIAHILGKNGITGV